MPRRKRWAYTDLSTKNSLYITINGERYEVSAYVSWHAINEIPKAQVTLAVGRRLSVARSLYAKIHQTGNSLPTMARVKVFFSPRGDYDPDGRQWPGGTQVIFEGWLAGLSRRKVSGKMTVIANLLHWSTSLTFSSMLAVDGHTANPSAINSRAVYQSLNEAGAAVTTIVSSLDRSFNSANVTADLWGSLKGIFCSLASRSTASIRVGDCVTQAGTPYSVNYAAQESLRRIEGPAENCHMDYKFASPLTLDTSQSPLVAISIQRAIGGEMISSFSGLTFWDNMIRFMVTSFHLAIVPMVDRLLVVPYVPAYRGYWKEIKPIESTSEDASITMDFPIRSIGVVIDFPSPSGAAVGGSRGNLNIGGCFAANTGDEDYGVNAFVPAPSWLRMLAEQYGDFITTSNLGGNSPTPSAASPEVAAAEAQAAALNRQSAVSLYNRYAQSYYVLHNLRGRGTIIGSKLRFDIAPGSNVKLNYQPEIFIGAEDNLAVTQYGNVNRVTTVINAEAAKASTTFTVTHVRNEVENQRDGTSVTSHPLFTADSIHGNGKHGAPLLQDYDI